MDLKARKAAYLNSRELRKGMEQANLDLLVAISAKNSSYLTGCYLESQVFSRERLGLAVVAPDGADAFIVCNLQEPQVRYNGTWVDDVRMYIEYAETPIESFAKYVQEKGLSQGRIGIEEKYFTVAYHGELKQRLPNTTFVPVDALLGRVRALKTTAEIDLLQKVAVLTEEATHAAWKRSHPGDSEKDVADRMAEEITARGAARTT